MEIREVQGVTERLPGIIFNSISDGVFTVDRQRIITSFNKAAERKSILFRQILIEKKG